ncbi:tyrosine-type recombinase/integrase [Rhizobium sp. 0TCS1.26]|uniref:tyrosine-type recombinase/integrase n=1 Tax=Rhizobium sp. 0TCS1.26 TaxID=3142623 RepID=UPI003D2DF8E3
MNMTFRPTRAVTLAHVNAAARTFGEAAASYIEHGGERKYLERILPHIGITPIPDIFPFDVRQLATSLFPSQTNATRNRCVITPIRAVCYHAYDRGWGPQVRIRNFKQERPKRKKAASQAWVHAFVRQCARDGLPHVAAIVLFMSQTGARVSEAVALRWRDVDMAGRTALLVKTKTEFNSTRYLTDQLVTRLREMSVGAHPDSPVFGYRNRHSVNERIAAVCQRAGIYIQAIAHLRSACLCQQHPFHGPRRQVDHGGWWLA